MAFSLNDNYIIVNYHYVRDPHRDFSGIHPCPIADFEKHILFLSLFFTPLSIPELFRAATGRRKGKFCAVTFDDGTNDQRENAVPILKKYNVHATFFIITKTFEGLLPFTHKVHLILSRFSIRDLLREAGDFFTKFYPDQASHYDIPTNRRLTTMRKMYDDIPTANFKEMIHNVLPRKEREHFIDFIFGKIDFSEKQASEMFFIPRPSIAALHKEGFSIGSHTHSHAPLDCQTDQEVQSELSVSTKYLQRIIGTPPTIFSYPHSHSKEKEENTAKILRGAGFQYAVTTERREIKEGESPFTIPRYDANEISDFLKAEAL